MAAILRNVPGVRVANVYRYPDIAILTRTVGTASNVSLETAVRNGGFWGRVISVRR